jgi:hypothetical protein
MLKSQNQRIGEVHLHLTAQQPLRTDTEGIANNEHSNHQHRIDRWAAERRVVARQLCVHPGKVQHSGYLADLVIIRNDFIEAERIEKLPLVPVAPPHHRSPPQRIASEATESPFAETINDFCNKICPSATSRGDPVMTASGGEPVVSQTSAEIRV